jgi:hypothetical protein
MLFLKEAVNWWVYTVTGGEGAAARVARAMRGEGEQN